MYGNTSRIRLRTAPLPRSPPGKNRVEYTSDSLKVFIDYSACDMRECANRPKLYAGRKKFGFRCDTTLYRTDLQLHTLGGGGHILLLILEWNAGKSLTHRNAKKQTHIDKSSTFIDLDVCTQSMLNNAFLCTVSLVYYSSVQVKY